MSDAAEEALAHCHVSSLLARYYQAIDTADWTMLEHEVLAEDAVWEVIQRDSVGTVSQTVEGRAAILDWFRTLVGGEVSMGEGTPGAVRHFITTTSITVDADRARSTSHLQALGTEPLAVLANGVVHAEHVRTPAGWRTAHYRIDERITDADMKAFMTAFGLRYD